MVNWSDRGEEKSAGEAGSKLQPGQVVMVYVDPITREVPEGKARLVARLIADPEMEYWKVLFLDDIPRGRPKDLPYVERWIAITPEE